MSLFCQRLAVLSDLGQNNVLGIIKGIEKESLRITPEGRLAHTAHPDSLGSALTHSRITTDFSESLLEFITPPCRSTTELLAELEHIHAYTYQQLQDELLWVASMPCQLRGDDDIPVARYGSSNVGQMKTIYRLGLGERYGRMMQAIAGIHYNFSLDDAFWDFWWPREKIEDESLQDFKSRRYFDLIRNFRRNFWLLLYLFGASPAVCRSFVQGRSHNLQPFPGDQHSYFGAQSTSLRMGDLGYQSNAQSSLVVSYNDLPSYVGTLCGAITQAHPDYQKIGIKDAEGHYHQLNDSLLQIENEFYSTIRPKRTAESGETALTALCRRGVEYIEVRCIDLNPYLPMGVDAEQLYFLDAFLLTCLLADSPATDCVKYKRAQENQRLMVNAGRNPELYLKGATGDISVASWGRELLQDIERVAVLLDQVHGGDDYTRAVMAQYDKLDQPERLPSAQLLADMGTNAETFSELGLRLSEAQRDHFRGLTLPADWLAQMQGEVSESLRRQQQVEAADTLDFETYLAAYYDQYRCCQNDG